MRGTDGKQSSRVRVGGTRMVEMGERWAAKKLCGAGWVLDERWGRDRQRAASSSSLRRIGWPVPAAGGGEMEKGPELEMADDVG